jgi:hypothetical protein
MLTREEILDPANFPLVGTSLEVLAPYLPYGVSVQGPFPGSEYPGTTRKLLGLSSDEQGGIIETENAAGFKDYSYLHFFWPVLRPFSQLCTPLEDGTVPAVEVAKLLLNDWAKEYSYRIVGSKSATAQNFTVHVFKWKPAIGEVLAFRLSFLLDWNWLLRVKWEETIHHLENIAQAIDYLRSKHFAVGLAAHQFIEASPSPSAPTTREKEEG